MRIVSGLAKGRKLKSVPGSTTRPIADRVKVALFDILAGELADASILDLFAGTGGVGIEALSRGARRAVFIDNEPRAIRIIRENLLLTRMESRSEVIHTDSFRYLERKSHEVFDIIFIAPPQYKGLWQQALQFLDRFPEWLIPDGLAIAQIHPREYLDKAMENLREFDQRKYGNTLLVFYERIEK